MAFSVPSESPAVTIREVDLTGVVRNTTTTTGAFAGNFRWGPVGERVDVADEAQLASNFGTPNDAVSVDYHSAAMFLRYSQDLLLVRHVDSSARNSYVTGDGAGAPIVLNETNFENQMSALDSDGHTFIARYPSDIGNSLRVSICPADSAEPFNSWAYSSQFDGAPGTSNFATARGASNDEVHVAVIDQEGSFSGIPGNVLETYSYLSLASNAKSDDGSTNYVKNVINNASNYIWMAGFDSDYTVANAGTEATSGKNYSVATGSVKTSDLASGVASGSVTTGKILESYDHFDDVENVQVDFLIAPQSVSQGTNTTVVNYLNGIAQSTRKDCVVVASPPREAVINNNNPTTSIVAGANALTNSSYLILDNNYLKVYDKYNDKYIYVPAASSTAGIMAASDVNTAPWFSPAGTRRGQYLGITSLAYSPNKSERDTLYKVGVNPIANIPGSGVLLFGDKTKLLRPSAFDRINVRRLFLVIERAIGEAAKQVIFEFNDEFTRAEFVNIVEPYLREIQGRRGITDFRVVCDETNNTPALIDRNEFKADLFIKPARSINYVTLNFVATRTGVDFEEVVGTV
jgi:phage tail sheath protein FI